jgi:predicted Ser/Thr protein kinase
MDYKEIKGKKHYVYNLTEWEIKYPKSKLESWRVGQEGDWVLTDDNHVVQILKKATYNGMETVRCITGTYKINSNHFMGSDIPENIYSFSKENRYKAFKNKKEPSRKEFMFAQYVARGEGTLDSYLKAFKTNNKDYAKRRANELLHSERVRKMVSEEIKEILDGEGVTPGYIIQVFKQVCDVAEKDGDRLRALENLAKIAGLFETEKKSEQLTVFAGFTDEQMKAISNGQSKKLTSAKQES